MDKVQKYNSFNTNTPPSESYRNYGESSSVIKCHFTAFLLPSAFFSSPSAKFSLNLSSMEFLYRESDKISLSLF
jgi:hypothetical protein